MLLSLLFTLSGSFEQKKFKLYSISTYLSSLSNVTFKGNGHSLISSSLLNMYSNHPIFLGMPQHSPIDLSIYSMHFKLITSPLINGYFSRVTLDSLKIDKAILINDRCSDLININSSVYFPFIYNCNTTIRNCHIENFFPSVEGTSKHSSVIQSYDSNVYIDRCSFLYCNSNTSPVLFSAVSEINFLFSNFSFNYGETEGVFSMTHSIGSAKGCFFGNNEAYENGVSTISGSVFNFNSNAIVHNRANINSILFLDLSNSTFNHNYFVANRIQGSLYGIVSIYDDLSTSTSVSFINCVFSLNKELEDIDDKINSKFNKNDKKSKKLQAMSSKKRKSVSGSRSIYSIFYRGDDSILLHRCAFDTDYQQSVIVFDGGKFINSSSSFGKPVQTQYDVFDGIPFIESGGFKMDFEASKSAVYSICVLVFVVFAISVVLYLLDRISHIFL